MSRKHDITGLALALAILLMGTVTYATVSWPLANPSSGPQTVEALNELHTPGAIVWFGMTSIPTGYLKCDGSAVSRTVYSELFGNISTTYGDGDGSTTFNLPKAPIKYVAYAKLSDTKTSGTDGGTATSGAWQTRDLNTKYDPDGFVNLTSNQFILDAGIYRIAWSCPARVCNKHQSAFYNTSTAIYDLIGTVEQSGSAADYAATRSFGCGEFTVGANQPLEIRHRVETTKATYGFGKACGWTSEVYTIVELWKRQGGIWAIKY